MTSTLRGDGVPPSEPRHVVRVGIGNMWTRGERVKNPENKVDVMVA